MIRNVINSSFSGIPSFRNIHNAYLYDVRIISSYKYKLKPNQEQRERIDSWIATCRAVYNLALETKIYAYQTKKVNVSRFDLQKQLIELKLEYHWVKDVQSQVLQHVLLRLDKTYKTFFNGGGFPKFAKKDFYKSICFPQSVKLLPFDKIKFPKLGILRFFKSKLPTKEAKIKQATITKEIDGYYVSLNVEEEKEEYVKGLGVVGLDMGVAKFCTTSNGSFIENPVFLEKHTQLLRKLQRSLSRKKKGSNNRKKIKQKLAKLHLKISRKRQDFLHKHSTSLICDNQTIVVEDLKLKNMTKSSKGNLESPGKNVKQKSGLNRVILDVSIGEFFRQLEYKANWYGRGFVKVDPKYTSQTCSKCGYKAKENRKTQAVFECVNCGHKENADVNAAKNILARAEPMYANVVH